MAYYNGKKVLSVVKTDQAQFPTYEGSYKITENGTYPTAYKAFVENLVVDVVGEGVFEQCLAKRSPTDYGYLFSTNGHDCLSQLTYDILAEFFAKHDTSIVTTADNMFDRQKLARIPWFDTSNVTSMVSMFNNCSNLETIPALDTSNVTSMISMFSGCTNLKSIPALNIDKCRTSALSYAFSGCTNLEEIHMINIGVNFFDIKASTKFTREALNEIIGNLKQLGGSPRLVMGATNLAKLTNEDIAVATNKGWTLS